MSKRAVAFHLQPTPSFPDGAPQREEYVSDGAHDRACDLYANEWNAIFTCTGCAERGRHGFDCPSMSRPPAARAAGGKET